MVGTASPAKFDYVRSLGAATVLDYKDEQIVSKLKDLGPFDFIMMASGGAKAAKAISDILQPTGGTFASTSPRRDEMGLAENVTLLYGAFSMATQKPENASFTKWWYEDYLPAALAGGVTPTPLEKRPGGLAALDRACQDILENRSSKKLVVRL